MSNCPACVPCTGKCKAIYEPRSNETQNSNYLVQLNYGNQY